MAFARLRDLQSRKEREKSLALFSPAISQGDLKTSDARPDKSAIAHFVERFMTTAYGRWFSRTAIRGGTWEQRDVRILVRRKWELSLGVAIAGLLIVQVADAPIVIYLLLLPLLAFFGPDLYLYNRALKRVAAIEEALPETIDLISMCVNAGLGFQAGMKRVSESHDNPLSEEFRRVLSQMRLGESRAHAFNDLSERIGLESLRQFVNSVLQVDRLGIPVARVLEDQATSMRAIRKERAREQAQKVPVKILAPVMLFLLPSIMIIVLGPAVISIARAFGR